MEWDEDEDPPIPIGLSNRSFPLRQRARANGVRLLQQVVRTESTQCDLSVSASHSIRMAMQSYSREPSTLGERNVVMWEYAPDEASDMFQFGRLDGASSTNDVVIRGRLHNDPRVGKTGPTSRYAFRIVCTRGEDDEGGGSSSGSAERTPPAPRIYAAGFDSRRRIRIGTRAPRWAAPKTKSRRSSSSATAAAASAAAATTAAASAAAAAVADAASTPAEHHWDAMTTFGIRVWNPRVRSWFEVSTNGAMHMLRPTAHSSTTRTNGAQLVGKPVAASIVTNELVSGSIVDSCGVLLLWEGAEHWNSSSCVAAGEKGRRVAARGVEAAAVERLAVQRLQCPVLMQTLRFPPAALSRAVAAAAMGRYEHSKPPRGVSSGGGGSSSSGGSFSSSSGGTDAWVFTACGHVLARSEELRASRTCPMCRATGPFVPLVVRASPSVLLMDRDAMPTHVYTCGCATTATQAAQWSTLPVPVVTGGAIGTVRSAFHPLCPHCSSSIAMTGASKLFFAEDDVDDEPASAPAPAPALAPSFAPSSDEASASPLPPDDALAALSRGAAPQPSAPPLLADNTSQK